MKNCYINEKEMSKNDLSLIDPCDITGWRYLGEIEVGKYSDSDKVFFKTGTEAWLDEFKICLIWRNSTKYVILVSPNCPDYYFGTSDVQDKLVSISIPQENISGYKNYDYLNEMIEKYYNSEKSLSPINTRTIAYKKSIPSNITWTNSVNNSANNIVGSFEKFNKYLNYLNCFY